jgi:MFS superfamily sulfate permease-like transporter
MLSPRPAAGFARYWRADLTAGFLVSLIALPLCFGIAAASGFPPIAGVISSIVGGLLVSRFKGVPLGITGPAAGLITILYSAVQSLGAGDALAGYRYTLAAVVLSGVLQVLLGITRTGRIAALFPAAIAHGMLAAIGITIIARQAHILLGARPEVETVWQSLGWIPASLFHFQPAIFLVGLSGLLVLFGWPLLGSRGLGRVPAPMVAVLIGYAIGRLFDLNPAALYVRSGEGGGLLNPVITTTAQQFLADIPDHLADMLVFPDFGKVLTPGFWSVVAALFLVGSLESLLVASAVDRMSPGTDAADLNRDVAAVGLGNVVSGLIGGLPVIVEIVRSSANIGYGARSATANFFHGLFLLLFIAFLPQWLERIPLATLAALLIYAGYQLASPKTFAKVWEIGPAQLALFLLTLVAVLSTNILAGVAIALAAKLLISRWLGGPGTTLRGLFRLSYRVTRNSGNTVRIHIEGPLVFSNYLPLQNELARLPPGGQVIIDVSGASLVDHNVLDFMGRFGEGYTAAGGRCEIAGLEHLTAHSDHPLATRFQ